MISVFDLFSIGLAPPLPIPSVPCAPLMPSSSSSSQQGHLPHTARSKWSVTARWARPAKGTVPARRSFWGCRVLNPNRSISMPFPPFWLEWKRAAPATGRRTAEPLPRTGAIIFNRRKTLPAHTNGMTLRAFADENLRFSQTYYSIGGGFIIEESHFATAKEEAAKSMPNTRPLPVRQRRPTAGPLSGERPLHLRLILANERVFRSDEQIKAGLRKIWQAMQGCVERGCKSEGVLPGGLKVKRRAPALYRQLCGETNFNKDPLMVMEWVDLFALAVNEENAAGGRVVTAPTNGAAGIIPAVLHYYDRFVRKVDDELLMQYFLTAAAIGILYKKNASLSGAEVGCQGEVGVACSMAAGALAELLGGSPAVVENAAEIGMEHNLGLTCDPIGGLVQVPCIERNAMGAVKAINAARLALRGTGEHKVSLDKVIRTMWETGNDMKTKYKETARGGLAVNITEC
ncbi:L-serine ammonia-lyase [Aeromonas sp. A-5]|uniref:L-serine ammonia-lyase n=1 Tax=Aeromonas ichthyocola TaxID=3367746 RepID=UPI0038E467F7